MDGPKKTLVIGIGNPSRGDDAAGRMVVRSLAADQKKGSDQKMGSDPCCKKMGSDPFYAKRNSDPDPVFIEHDGEAAGLVAALEGASTAVLVDACASGAPPGTVRRFDAAAAPLPADRFGVSTHGVGLAAALELARALGQLPPRCVVYAIEGRSFAAGAALSPPVAAGVETAAARIRDELALPPSDRSVAPARRRYGSDGIPPWIRSRRSSTG